MKQLKTIAIIPARGGSKRLPLKNIKMLGGLPLLVHSIKYAQKHSNILDAIIVSTDDSEIKSIALKYGATVIDRPETLSNDSATTVSALQHVLQELPNTVEDVVLLQPTNPLRPKTLLNEALSAYKEQQADNLMTVTRSYHKLGTIDDQKFVPYNYTVGQRSQDLKPLYFENGLLYIAKAELIRQGKLFNEQNFPFIVDHPFAGVDIDDAHDFDHAEFMLQHYKNI